jgi:tryptophan synthase alpha chain
MNRYAQAFGSLRSRNEAAFIPFAVAGDPSLATSERVFGAYIDAGADVLEIGYPFSDPVADGPTNQRAAIRAIDAGITPRTFFALMARVRARTDVPIGLLMYANTIHHYGYDAFCRRAAVFLEAVKRHGLASVFIVSELTPPARIRTICRHTTGFVYVVSRLGTTGVQSKVDSGVAGTLKRLRAVTDLPLCVGFGLSTPEHIVSVRDAGADGAIVGSALVATIERLGDRPDALTRRLKTMVRQYKRATCRV